MKHGIEVKRVWIDGEELQLSDEQKIEMANRIAQGVLADAERFFLYGPDAPTEQT